MQKKCPRKGVIFVQISIINCVYLKRHKYKMSTLLHAVFNILFGNLYFVLLIWVFHGRKMQFSEGSQKSISEISIIGHFEVIFLNV